MLKELYVELLWSLSMLVTRGSSQIWPIYMQVVLQFLIVNSEVRYFCRTYKLYGSLFCVWSPHTWADCMLNIRLLDMK